MLRAVFAPDLTQRVLAEVPAYRILCLDVSASPVEDAEAAWTSLVQVLSHRVLPADQWRLCCCIDLLIADVVSIGIVFRDLLGIYFGERSAAAPSLTFRDVVLH